MEIEKLDLDVKTYNRLKRDGINTTGKLLCEMYKGGEDITVSTPDAKKCEAALKDAGIIKYMRGDYVTEEDIEPEPLTWDELHDYIGKLVVHDESTESRRYLVVCWLYDVKDQDCGNAIFISRGTSFGHARRTTVNGELSRTDNPNLQNEGRFFALRQGTPLETLGLSTRTYNAAVRFGIGSVEELAERISEFCTHAPNCGREAEKALNKGGKTVSETQVMSADYTKAVTLTKRIKANAAVAQESLWEVCKGLKEMHDGKLYKELGYSHFKEYCENELEVTDRQARNYISLADSFSDEERKSISTFGTTKLLLLAKLDEPQREEIQQNVDIESVTVKELKAEIEKLNNEKKGYKERQDKLLQKNKELVSDIEKGNKERTEIFDKLERTEGERDRLEDDLDEAKDTIKSLEQQLEELENKPHDSYEDTTKIEALKVKLAEAEKRADENNKSAYNDNAVFSAYASAATDAMRRLTQFCERRGDSSEKTVFIAKLKMIVTLTEQTIEKIGG